MALWEWQQREVNFHALDPSRALFWEPRTGKTLGTVECMKRANSELGIKRFLVVAPPLAGATTWKDTLSGAEWPALRHAELVSGPLSTRKQRIREAESFESHPTVIVVNYEALHRLYESLAAWGPQGIVADEMHLIRSAGAKRTKALVKLGDKAAWKRGLTGTPTPRDYSNIYAQYRFLDPSIFGTNLQRFRERYIISHPTWKNKVLGYVNLPELQQKMHSIASVVLRATVFGVDGVQPPVNQEVILPQNAKRLYDRLAREYVLDNGNGPGIPISHKLSRLNTLAQLASGFFYENGYGEQLSVANVGGGSAGFGDSILGHDRPRVKWVHEAKIDALREELGEYFGTTRAAVIFYRFAAEGLRIQHLLHESTDSAKVRWVGGHTPANERVQTLKQFGTKDGAQFLILQEQVGSLGISLAKASTCIFFSHSFAYDVHVQAKDRIWKPGPEPLLHVYLRAQGTVDYFGKQVIESKEVAENLLLQPGSFERAVRGETV